VNGVTDSEIKAQVENSKKFLAKIADLYEPANGPWIWGQRNPTALDVQVAVFIARLHDVRWCGLVPAKIAQLRENVIGDIGMAGVVSGAKYNVQCARSGRELRNEKGIRTSTTKKTI